MKIRRMLPGSHEPTAAAPGDTTDKPITFLADAGSALLIVATDDAAGDALPNSRRV
jgi:hypothetical protein